VDAPLRSPHDLVRPWRRATLVASAIAALELVLLAGTGSMLLAKPLAHLLRSHAAPPAATVAKKAAAPAKTSRVEQAIRRQSAPPAKARPRGEVKIMVLNGNGRAGAAGSTATLLHGIGYQIAGTANAHRQDYATTVVMYRPGYRAEGLRLAQDLHVSAVGPLDGLKPAALDGGELVVILGA
jgi:LytR cell envelope-related transcriptional attenuator